MLCGYFHADSKTTFSTFCSVWWCFQTKQNRPDDEKWKKWLMRSYLSEYLNVETLHWGMPACHVSLNCCQSTKSQSETLVLIDPLQHVQRVTNIHVNVRVSAKNANDCDNYIQCTAANISFDSHGRIALNSLVHDIRLFSLKFASKMFTNHLHVCVAQP